RLRVAELRRELLLDRAGEARQLGQGERTAADPPDGGLDVAADETRKPLRTGSDRLERLGEHPQYRHLPGRKLRVEVERERRLERRQSELVCAQCPLERMPAQSLDELGAAGDDPRLGAAEQLVAGEADEVGSGLEALARCRLVAEQQAAAREERTRAEVVDEREAVCTGNPDQIGELRLLGEADD